MENWRVKHDEDIEVVDCGSSPRAGSAVGPARRNPPTGAVPLCLRSQEPGPKCYHLKDAVQRQDWHVAQGRAERLSGDGRWPRTPPTLGLTLKWGLQQAGGPTALWRRRRIDMPYEETAYT